MNFEKEYKSKRKQLNLNRQFFLAVLRGDMKGAVGARKAGADVNAIDSLTEMAPLHAAIVTDNLSMAKYVIEECKADICQDGQGRWPTFICTRGASMRMNTYILEKESAACDSLDLG